jgi:hypothetical protein
LRAGFGNVHEEAIAVETDPSKPKDAVSFIRSTPGIKQGPGKPGQTIEPDFQRVPTVYREKA